MHYSLEESHVCKKMTMADTVSITVNPATLLFKSLGSVRFL